MGILFSLLLIALGVCAAQDFLSEKFPKAKGHLAEFCKFRDYIGIAGLLIGLDWLLEWLSTVRFITYQPFYVLLALAAVLLTLGLGLLFGLEFVRKNIRDPNAPFIVKLDGYCMKMRTHQRELGLAAIVIGVFYLFMHVMR